MRADQVTGTIRRIDTPVLQDMREDNILFHTDQGSQYGAHQTIDSLMQAGFERSMSRAGTPTDNPFAERFMGVFKHAVVRRRKYATLGEFETITARWINFYNDERPHEGLYMQPPNIYVTTIGRPIVSKMTKLCVVFWVLDTK